MGARHRKAHQLSHVQERHVDNDVIEVLAGDALVIGDENVFRIESVGPFPRGDILDDDAEISDEVEAVPPRELAESYVSARVDPEELRLVELPVVQADEERVLQLIDNLVGNALKFTPSGGRVSIGGFIDTN